MSYFRIPEKFSGENKRGLPCYLPEEKKQKKRKEEHEVSRVLDNYYNSGIHKRAWIPNGLFLRKKLYSYSDSGLGYFYENKNVEQKKDITEIEPRSKQKVGQAYIEQNYLESNQYNVTIEYCANCQEHSLHTRHSPELYKNYATRLQQCIHMRFPFIIVMLKPIDTDILQEELYHKKYPKIQKNGGKFDNSPIINDKFKDVRIGAFEVQISMKNKKGEIETALIHSKLRSGKWPKIRRVLDKIVNFLPSFTGEIHLFEKEELESLNNSEEQKNDIDNETLIEGNKLYGRQINIYLLKNENLNQIINLAEKDIEIELDPKMRMDKINVERKSAKESPFNLNSSISCSLFNKSRISSATTRLGSSKTRIDSGKTRIDSGKSRCNKSTGFQFKSNGISRCQSASVLGGNRPKSSTLFRSYANNNFSKNYGSIVVNKNIIENKKEGDALKGTLVIRKFTNKDGVIKFGPLPYDSYFIEVVESNEFKFVGSILEFSQILPENEIYKKYFGLMIQDNAFLQIHIYEIKKNDENEEQVHVKDTNLIIQSYNDEISEDIKRPEIKLKISETKPGIYEHNVETGKYLIECTKKGYETVRKVVEFDKGLNCINIEMVPVRRYVFKIAVFNLMKYILENKNEYLKNCEIFVYKNSTELLLEGITDKQGQFMFSIGEEINLITIVIQKLGFRPIQRKFIKTKQVQLNENNEYEQLLFFYLIKDNFFESNNISSMIFGYSNRIEENFKLASPSIL